MLEIPIRSNWARSRLCLSLTRSAQKRGVQAKFRLTSPTQFSTPKPFKSFSWSLPLLYFFFVSLFYIHFAHSPLYFSLNTSFQMQIINISLLLACAAIVSAAIDLPERQAQSDVSSFKNKVFKDASPPVGCSTDLFLLILLLSVSLSLYRTKDSMQS